MANKCVQPFFHMKKMADLVPVTYVYNTSNIALSSFRGNGFFSFTTLKQKTDTQTDTPNDYRNPRCACAPRVNYAENIHSIIILGDNNCLFYRVEPQEVISVSPPDLSPVAPPYSLLCSPVGVTSV